MTFKVTYIVANANREMWGCSRASNSTSAILFNTEYPESVCVCAAKHHYQQWMYIKVAGFPEGDQNPPCSEQWGEGQD